MATANRALRYLLASNKCTLTSTLRSLHKCSKITNKQLPTASVLETRGLLQNVSTDLNCVTPVKNVRKFSRTAIKNNDKNIVKSPYGDKIDVPDITVTEYLFKKLDENGDQKAVTCGVTGRSYTFTQLKAIAIRVASGLTKLGYKKGDTICIFSPNIPEFGIMMLAFGAIGVTITSANPQYSEEELSRQLQHSSCNAIITIPHFAELVKNAVKHCPLIKEVICFGDATGCRPFASLMEDDGKAFPENVDFNLDKDIFVLPYSSGTTGLPKGVMLTHRNILSNIIQTSYVTSREPGDKVLGLLPFFHIYGMVACQFHCYNEAIELVTLPRFDPEEFLKVIADHKLTILPVVPPLVLFMAKNPMTEEFNLESVRMIVSGAAPLSAELAQDVMKKFPHITHVVQGYGLTETSPVTHAEKPEFYRDGTVGRLVPATEAKIVDPETGTILGPNEEGELCLRGPQIMMGYLDNQEATDATIKEDGWLYTGDLSMYDNDGHFKITERLKELIKYKGMQVAPAELEALLLTHPGVADAAVIGIPDDEAGELPRAYVVQSWDPEITEGEIEQFVADHLAPFKKLRGGVEFIDQIPKSPSGKILRRILVQMAAK